MITTKHFRKDADRPSTIPIWSRWGHNLGHRFHSVWNRIRGKVSTPWAESPNETTAGMTLRVGSQTAKGRREINEDRCYVDASHGILLAVDGMGGHNGGETASQIIVETIPDYIRQAIESTDVDQYSIQECIEQAIEESRHEMIHYAERHAGFSGMGATLALAVVAEDRAFVTNVGDSRAYRLHGCELCRLTSDDTFVQALISAGALTEAAARNHPLRHVVTNFVGVKPLDHRPEIVDVPLDAGDEIVLTTDGITDVLDDEAIVTILSSHQHPQSASTAIVSEAIANASKDNVTCVVGRLIVLNQRAISPENGESVSLLCVA